MAGLVISCQVEYPELVKLISPADGAIFDTVIPEFTWHSDPVASDYIIRILDETGTGILEDSLKDTTFTIPDTIFNQIADGIYKWMVAPLPAMDELLWSDSRTFILDKEGYQTPMLIIPEDGDTFYITPPKFVWHSSIGANSYVVRIVKGAFFTGEVIVEDTLEDTTYTLPQEDFEIALNSDYVWSVAPLSPQGGLTWREFWEFTLNKPMPSGPEQISPTEGTEFTDAPPSFVWHSDALAKAYIFLLHGENLPYGDTIVVDTLEDTTYALSRDIFEVSYNGTYKWSVASVANTNQSFWSMQRSLTFNQPQVQFDLDTTYFPFGLGYEWVYEEHGEGINGYGSASWLDTITIRVVDSSFAFNGWSFNLQCLSQNGLGSPKFFDVGNPARLVKTSVIILGNKKIDVIPISMKEVNPIPDGYEKYEISYTLDTLQITTSSSVWHEDDPHGWGYDKATTIARVREIGTVKQVDYYWYGYYNWNGYSISHRLIQFSKNGTLVWQRK